MRLAHAGMGDTLTAVIAIVALFVGLPVVVLWLRDRASRADRHRPESPERLAAIRRAFEERLLRPDWAFYERHLRRHAPSALRELYADRGLVTAQDVQYADDARISTFNPLDEQGLLDARRWIGLDVVPLGTSDFGDPLYLRPGSSEADAVYLTHHDGGDTEVFAESVAVMVQRLRHGNGTPPRA
jgi:hypothetical protein